MSSLISRRELLIGGGAVLVAGSGSYVTWRALTKPSSNDVIRAGYLNIIAGLPILVANELGIFRRRGLNIELVELRTGNDVATAAIAGQIDFIGGAATNAVLDASVESGRQFKVFVVNNYFRGEAPGTSSDFLIARPEITSIEQLRGKRIAIYPGSVGQMFAPLVFPRLGLPLDQIEIVELGPAQWQPSLVAGDIAAVTALEPFATQILADGAGHILVDGYYAQIMPTIPASGSWFVQGRLLPETEVQIVDAFAEAIGAIERDRALVNRVIAKRLAINARLAPQVRLLRWNLSTDAATQSALQQYLALLQSANATRFTGTPDQWIWRAPS